MAFVDGDDGDYAPIRPLRRRTVQLVVTSSPKGTNQPWMKQGGQGSSVHALVTKLWSYNELILTGLVLGLLLSALN